MSLVSDGSCIRWIRFQIGLVSDRFKISVTDIETAQSELSDFLGITCVVDNGKVCFPGVIFTCKAFFSGVFDSGKCARRGWLALLMSSMEIL
jgi:hypothetical protein